METLIQIDKRPDAGGMKVPLILSVALHAMILILFVAGIGIQSGGPGEVEVMYVSLVQILGPVQTLDPGPKTQDPGAEIQNAESGPRQARALSPSKGIQNSESVRKEVTLNSQPSTFNVQLSTLVDEPTTNNQQLTTSDLDSPISNFEPPISNFQSRISNPENNNPEPIAVTAYTGEIFPAGMLGSGENADAGLIYIPPTTIKLPRPAYPIVSRRKGEDGTVTLSFLVYSDGTVGGISVVRSSGYPRLDKAASKSLSSAVFRPASEKGLPVNSSSKIAFSFRLKD